jgi:tetratricopeptide (TPR) repeat protein
MYAAAGNATRARTLLDEFAKTRDTAMLRNQQSRIHEARGEIAVAEKQYAVAIDEFRRADVAYDGQPDSRLGVRLHFNLGRAFDLANQPDSAIAQLEAYTAVHDDSRIDDDVFALAGAHKRLGELYDAKGDRERAISHLSKFVELWKNADPDLQPAVADAKRRLARLQAGVKG